MSHNTHVLRVSCTALLGQESGSDGYQTVASGSCAVPNLLAAGPSISIINVHKFRT